MDDVMADAAEGDAPAVEGQEPLEERDELTLDFTDVNDVEVIGVIDPADYNRYLHVRCEHCGQEQPLLSATTEPYREVYSDLCRQCGRGFLACVMCHTAPLSPLCASCARWIFVESNVQHNA